MTFSLENFPSYQHTPPHSHAFSNFFLSSHPFPLLTSLRASASDLFAFFFDIPRSPSSEVAAIQSSASDFPLGISPKLIPRRCVNSCCFRPCQGFEARRSSRSRSSPQPWRRQVAKSRPSLSSSCPPWSPRWPKLPRRFLPPTLRRGAFCWAAWLQRLLCGAPTPSRCRTSRISSTGSRRPRGPVARLGTASIVALFSRRPRRP